MIILVNVVLNNTVIMLLTVTDILTTYAVVFFRVKAVLKKTIREASALNL